MAAVDLAKVEFAQVGPQNLVSTALDIQGDALAITQRPACSVHLFLAPARRRRRPDARRCQTTSTSDLFGFEDVAVNGTHALGYEESR